MSGGARCRWYSHRTSHTWPRPKGPRSTRSNACNRGTSRRVTLVVWRGSQWLLPARAASQEISGGLRDLGLQRLQSHTELPSELLHHGAVGDVAVGFG